MNNSLMPIYYLFETEAKMLGMYLSSFYNFALVSIGYLISPQIVGTIGISFGWMYYVFGFFLIIFLYVFFRRMGKNSYPNFISAWLSFMVLQPKFMSSQDFNLELKSLNDILNDISKDE